MIILKVVALELSSPMSYKKKKEIGQDNTEPSKCLKLFSMLIYSTKQSPLIHKLRHVEPRGIRGEMKYFGFGNSVSMCER